MTTGAVATAAPISLGENVVRPLRVAVVGAGPAGIYAADALMKSDHNVSGPGVSIDLFERMPAPFG
ncbi:FAD/NAD(P)-binding protein, partial [Rhodococcus sp. IEGM1428]|uniref:FAD/NAD(P)-binding protein n=1 Tax=Rhodococcus sp. IEGM1428 TaxID=3392191 RepID=UPI003D141F41